MVAMSTCFNFETLADRVAGATTEINALKEAFNQGETGFSLSRVLSNTGVIFHRQIAHRTFNGHSCSLRSSQIVVQGTTRTCISCSFVLRNHRGYE
jgi:hypothetical protein